MNQNLQLEKKSIPEPRLFNMCEDYYNVTYPGLGGDGGGGTSTTTVKPNVNCQDSDV